MIAKNILLAVDVGGSKVSAAAVTLSGEILGRAQESTCQEGPQAGIQQIIRLALQAVETCGISFAQVACLGAGMPAVLQPHTDQVLWAPKLAGWRNVPLRPALQRALQIPVYLEYDGHTAILGEWWQGSARGFHSVAELIIGTGIGGGMILDGQLYRGVSRLAGAVGWLAMTEDIDNPDPESRQIGFLDARASGPGLVQLARKLKEKYPQSSLGTLSEQGEISPVHIFTAARQGDKLALQVLEQLASWLGMAIANIISLINPQAVILGGGVGSQCQDLLPRIQQVARLWAQPFSVQDCQIRISQLGADAGLLGAAYGALLRWQTERDHTYINDGD